MRNGKYFLLLMDLLWIVGFVLILAISGGLTYFLLSEFQKANVNFFIAVPICVYLFINIYILVSGLLCYLFVPKLKEGRHSADSSQFVYWRIRWHFYSYVFLFFRQYLFYNRLIRFIYFKLMRINIKFSSYFAETVDMQDANNLLYIDENSGLGSEVIVATHFQLTKGKFMLGKIEIGKNTVISARTSISPDTKIGDNVYLQYDVHMGPCVTIGDNTTVGSGAYIYQYSRIGKNCRIGYNVMVAPKSRIPDGTAVPDFARWENGKIIKNE